MNDETDYQELTDICFENGGVSKPMVDKLFGYITANYTPNSTVESLNSQIAWLDGKVEEMREEVAERERVARIDELKHIREFWGRAIDRTLSDKPFNFVALQDIDNRIAELTKAKEQQ